MLATARPEAVFIAVPLHLHHAFATKALTPAHTSIAREPGATTWTKPATSPAVLPLFQRPRLQVGLQRRANPIYEQVQAMVASA